MNRGWKKLGAAAIIVVLTIVISGYWEERQERIREEEKKHIGEISKIWFFPPTWDSWDEDTKDDGYEIYIWWLNEHGEPAGFSGIRVDVTVNLYIQYYDHDTFIWDEPELLRTWDVSISSSNEYIHIPFGGYCEEGEYTDFRGLMEVIVHTPEQGDFEDREEVRLCP